MVKIYYSLVLAFFLSGLQAVKAQAIDSLLDKSQDLLEEGRIFSTKGIGMAFPMGTVSDVLSPRFSSEIGLQILMKNPKLFLYPALDYMNYRYDQQVADPDFQYRTTNASAKFYIGTVSLGYITHIKKFRVFSSAGLGGGLVNEPRSSVNEEAGEIKFENKSSLTGTLRLNTGFDYGKRTFKFFAEISYLVQTRQVQNANLHTLAINVGTKTNLYRLARSIESLRKKK